MREKKILSIERPDLLKDWDYEKNALICSPDDITIGSSKYVYWVCPQGHSYRQKIANRTSRGMNCPFCSRHRLLTGYNDLETMFPMIAAEWHPVKNGKLSPKTISARNSNKVWWKCSKGHEWQATVASRTDENSGHGCPYCSNRKLLKGYNDLETKYPDIAKEWDYEKNKDLLPSDVIAGSPRKVWWRCSRCGHEYYSQIASRTTMSSNCPKCDKRNHTSFPEQAIYFYLAKVFTDAENSYRADWLKKQEIDIYLPSIKTGIEYDGTHWHNSQRDIDMGKNKYSLLKTHGIRLIRVSEFEYPVDNYCDQLVLREDLKSEESLNDCISELFKLLKIETIPDIDVGRDNARINSQYYTELQNKSLKALFPQIAKEWDSIMNDGIGPEMVFAYSNEKFYWKCNNNHSYKASVYQRTRDDGKETGCPYCSNQKVLKGYNDLLTKNPEATKEWDYDKNENLTPDKVLPGSNKMVWWKCSEDHSYSQSIRNHVIQHQGCPYCSNRKLLKGYNDLETKYPDIAKEWNYERNDKKPNDYTEGTHQEVWWKCKKCGHEWKTQIVNRTRNKTGCPMCGISEVKSKLQLKVRCKETGRIFESSSEAAIWLGVSKSLISACARGDLKHAGGYHWEYVNE